jgi:energy-coupling factor transport system ATP-binding protein
MVRKLADDGMTVLMVEHRVEDVLRIKPNRVLFMAEGQIRYLGGLDGLSKVVNYSEVKLPAADILARAKHDPAPVELIILPSAASDNSTTKATTQIIGNHSERKAMVKFEEVAFSYEAEAEVLHGINLEIRRGDVIAVLGPNGAGKTTFVKHAIGLLKPKSGRVLVNGRDTKEASVAQIASTLGYVFQSPSHMLFAPTVYEELAFGPTNLKHPKDEIEEEVKEALRVVNLSEKEQDPPLALSFGQQKRVSIAAILAMRSRILVMDEPTAGQDYQNYMNFMDAILQLPGFEAILFITHDVDLAVIYANRVLLMAEGRLIADGKPQEVLRDFNRLKACRLVPSSLLALNVQRLPETGRFMRAEALAHI